MAGPFDDEDSFAFAMAYIIVSGIVCIWSGGLESGSLESVGLESGGLESEGLDSSYRFWIWQRTNLGV